MDWGTELWDQFENVDKHLHHGIEYSDKYMKFVQERSSIEQDYAKQLRRLVKKYFPKKKDDDASIFSTNKAFHSQLSELNDIAGQHEIVAENLLKSIVKALHQFVNDLRLEKKKAYQEGKQLQAVLDSHERSLEQTKKRFEKEWRESERAQAYFEKLDADPNVTKAEVDKARQASVAKRDVVEGCKTDYASALTKFNSEQRDHYHTHMPKVFENYRDMDERRIKKTSEVMEDFVKIDSDVKPIVAKCLDGMKRAAQAVDSNLDAKLVVEKYKSGFYIPNDKEFEDYTSPQHNLSANDEHANSPRNSMNLAKGGNKKGLSWLFGGKKSRPRTSAGGAAQHSDVETGSENGDSPEKAPSSVGSAPVTPQGEEELTPKSINLSRASSEKVVSEKGVSKASAPRTVSVSSAPPQDTSDGSHVTLRDKVANPEAIRQSLSAGKKKMMSIFKQKSGEKETGIAPKRPSKPPRRSVNISGPIGSDSAMLPSTENTIPVRPELANSNPPTAPAEHMYSEVHYSEDEFTDDSHDEVEDTPTKKVQESADYSHLPPEQRKKKLQKHIDELRQQLAKETDGKNAILKMQDVYRQNPSMGDAGSLEMQLKQLNDTIGKIETDLHQYETWYADASGGAPPPSRGTSVTHQSPNKAAYSQPLKTEETVRRPELKAEDSFADEFDDEAVGSCLALFDFVAESEGAMSMKEGDKFTVLEADKGDGWTRVLKNDMDGYVPTSYLEVEFF